MLTIFAPRHQMIRKVVLQKPEAIMDVTIHLWQSLAENLVSTIGNIGFCALYSRSVHLTSETFPWMEMHTPSRKPERADSLFADLKSNLEVQGFTEASEASIALLATFIDLLAMLIGDLLTTNILNSMRVKNSQLTCVRFQEHASTDCIEKVGKQFGAEHCSSFRFVRINAA